MDIKQFSEALGMLAPFESIIAQGVPTNVVSAAEGEASVRCLDAGGEMLVLVAAYAASPAAEVDLELKFPEQHQRQPMILVDVESGEVKVKLPADAKTLTAPLNRRARLFYLGPRSKLPIELTGKK